MSEINFFSEGLEFSLKKKTKSRNWLTKVAEFHGCKIGLLTFVFCSDDYLFKLNQQYLHHNTYTDIITFPYSEMKNNISGDIFISVERIRHNAKKYKVSVKEELRRVIAHGVLHLCGFNDKEPHLQKEMRKAEDHALAMWKKSNN